MKTAFILPLLAGGLALWAGCANVPTAGGFDTVEQQVNQRVRHRVVWRLGAAADARADAAMQELLQTNLTSRAAVQVALLNNRHLQATYEDLGVSQAALVQAGLLKNPVFDVAVRFPTSGGSTELELGVAQDFLAMLYLPLRKQVAAEEFASAQLRVTQAVLATAGDAQRVFYRLQADTQLRAMWEQVARSTDASLEVAKRLRAAGNITELALAHEQALHEEAKLDLQSAESRIANGRERLNALMGLWGRNLQWQITPRLPDVPTAAMPLDAVESQAIARNLELAARRHDVRAALKRLGINRAEALLPELEAGAVTERDGGHWSVGPAVAFPLPLFDQGQARVATAAARLRRHQQTYHAQAVDLRAATRAASRRLLDARRRAVHYRDVVLPLHDRIVQRTMLQYNAMQKGVFAVLLAKRQAIAAGQAYVESQHDYWSARGELELLLQGASPKPATAVAGAPQIQSSTPKDTH